MDCEKFDRIALDLLYEELDELTMVAAKRHLEQCVRCRELHARFRATREVGVMPLIDPPDGFEQRVLEAEQNLRATLPLGQRFGRAVSILAGYSMRPQLAMAALLLLMIGSSLIFLKARPGQRGAVHITERGVPGAEAESLNLPAPKPEAAPAPMAREVERSATQEKMEKARPPLDAAEGIARQEAEKKLKEAHRDELTAPSSELARRFATAPGNSMAPEAAIAAESEGMGRALALDNPSTKESDAQLALGAARELQQAAGCAPAAPKLEQVAARFPGTAAAYEATWRAAECRRLLGELRLARQGYQSLLGVDKYRYRAQLALDALRDQETEVAAKAKAEPSPAAPSKPSTEKSRGSAKSSAGAASPSP